MISQPITERKLREVFNMLKAKYPNSRIQASALREEKKLENNNRTLTYSFGEGTVISTERRLRRTDSFLIVGLGVFLAIEEVGKSGKAPLLTYPNPFQVGQIAIDAAPVLPLVPPINAKDLNVIYNGTMNITVNKNAQAESVDMQQFYNVPTTQENSINDLSEIAYGAGVISMEPHIMLHGSLTNDLTIEFPSWPGIAIQSHKANWDAKVIVKPIGFLISGVSGQ